MGVGGSKSFTRVLMIGLDGAGKTSLLQRIVSGAMGVTAPTTGWHAQVVKLGNGKFVFWDIGGSEKMRPLWRHQFRGTHVICFVVDASDSYRLHEAAEELHGIMQMRELENCVLIVLANKLDKPECLDAEGISRVLSLDLLCKGGLRPVRVQPVSALSGEGVAEALDWISTQFLVKR